MSFVFHCGTDGAHWLKHERRPSLFVSIRTLRRLKRWPRAAGPWAMDSGAFTEIGKHKRFVTSIDEYADEIERARDEIGLLEWAAPQDLMCEPEIVAALGLGIDEHHRRTIANFVRLRELVGPIVAPTLQGWEPADYVAHARMYRAAGFQLEAEPIVGVGSLCRRSAVDNIARVISIVEGETGARLHAYGAIRLHECSHSTCAHCHRWAYQWAREIQAKADRANVSVAHHLPFEAAS